MDRQWAVMEQAQITQSRYDSLAQLYQGLMIALVMVAALSLVMIYSIGDHPALAMLPLMLMACLEMMLPLPAAFQTWDETRLALARIFSIIDRNLPDQGKVDREISETITFNNVSFRYNDHSPLVLQDINFSIAPGQHTAITGVTGSGKSSLINLLCGLHVPTSGKISGHNPHIITVARQRPYLFAGTIRDNLLLAHPLATQEELDMICALTGLDMAALRYRAVRRGGFRFPAHC
jgi:ABC-type transport system involved in cytochrome bd biosynthesis fused ATPase/permease subunit